MSDQQKEQSPAIPDRFQIRKEQEEARLHAQKAEMEGELSAIRGTYFQQDLELLRMILGRFQENVEEFEKLPVKQRAAIATLTTFFEGMEEIPQIDVANKSDFELAYIADYAPALRKVILEMVQKCKVSAGELNLEAEMVSDQIPNIRSVSALLHPQYKPLVLKIFGISRCLDDITNNGLAIREDLNGVAAKAQSKLKEKGH